MSYSSLSYHQLWKRSREHSHSFQTLLALRQRIKFCTEDGLVFIALLLHEKLTTVLFPSVVEEEEERSSAEFEETINGTTVSSIILRSWKKTGSEESGS